MTNLTGEKRSRWQCERLAPTAEARGPRQAHGVPQSLRRLPLRTGFDSRTRKALAVKREDGKGFGAGNGDGKAQRKKAPDLTSGARSRRKAAQNTKE